MVRELLTDLSAWEREGEGENESNRDTKTAGQSSANPISAGPIARH